MRRRRSRGQLGRWSRLGLECVVGWRRPSVRRFQFQYRCFLGPELAASSPTSAEREKRLRPPRERLERREPRSTSSRRTLLSKEFGVVDRRLQIAADFGDDRKSIIGRLGRVRRDAFAQGALTAAPSSSSAAAAAALAFVRRSRFIAARHPPGFRPHAPRRAPHSPRRPLLQRALVLQRALLGSSTIERSRPGPAAPVRIQPSSRSPAPRARSRGSSRRSGVSSASIVTATPNRRSRSRRLARF